MAILINLFCDKLNTIPYRQFCIYERYEIQIFKNSKKNSHNSFHQSEINSGVSPRKLNEKKSIDSQTSQFDIVFQKTIKHLSSIKFFK